MVWWYYDHPLHNHLDGDCDHPDHQNCDQDDVDGGGRVEVDDKRGAAAQERKDYSATGTAAPVTIVMIMILKMI